MNVQSRIRIGLAAGAVGLLVAGCAFEPGDSGHEPLAGRHLLADMRAGELRFTAAHDGAPMPLVEPAVTGGAVVVRTAGDRLVLEELVIDLGDVDVTKQIGTTTQVLHLTDLRLRLGTQGDAAATWSSATHVGGLAAADLLLDWSLRATDGGVLPLATQRIRDAALDIQLDADDAGADVIARITSTTPGLLWELGDITVSDLSLSLVTAGELP